MKTSAIFPLRNSPRFSLLLLMLAALLLPLPSLLRYRDIPILLHFQIWQAIGAVLTGGALALSGSLFQTLFRNPLTSPYTLGVSTGAATGVALSFLWGLSTNWISPCAFCGSLLTLGAVLLFRRAARGNSQSLLLAGIFISTILSSLLLYLVTVTRTEELAGITWWTLGDLQGISRKGCGILLAAAIITLLWGRWHANELNVLILGDENAAVCGVSLPALQGQILVLASLLASLSVSQTGMIGFVGLAVPHAARWLWGSNQRRLPALTFLLGGIFLLFCRECGKWLSPDREIPIGVLTAGFGGSLFLLLLFHERSIPREDRYCG